MVCRQCGTEIADKAIICYKCGTATAVPEPRPASRAGGRSTAAVWAWALIAAAVAAAVWWYFR
jgi:hypothetical protein